MKVTLLTTAGKYGCETSAHVNQESARMDLDIHVRDWWDSDGPGAEGIPLPDNREVRIAEYFRYRGSSEQFEIAVCEVKDLTQSEKVPPGENLHDLVLMA
jgi:hypothetical protein